ncbi:MAG TPA: fumarylacetoacetate hydrolase family protein [Anaeromyxobacteraceae bacterium]|nr:fumarylacetoacetate hydrolase family protein [Anaeromyxobacteraceae bacterium]
MRFATLKDGTRDGRLCVVAQDGSRLADASGVARSLQAVLDEWESVLPRLRDIAAGVEAGRVPTEPVDVRRLQAPLPRAYEWVDGSAYLNHVRLVRRARGADLPPSLETDPLVYQGGSGVLLGPADDIPLVDPGFGLDFEGEIAVVLGDVPLGARGADALSRVRLVTMVNDVTLRNLVPAELAKGFGFFQSKPSTAFAPFFATPDELGDAWRDGRAHLRFRVWLNGAVVGDLDSGPEMHFSFQQLIEHVARTRAFTAGTILGSGTVSNADPARGISCLAERRTIEILSSPDRTPRTPFLAAGDRVAMEAFDASGRSVFGRIEQVVRAV